MSSSTAYHVTPYANLASIMQTGLIPAIGERSAELDEPARAIYLFPTVEHVNDALGNWLGECFEEDEELAVLKVNIESLAYTSDAGFELVITETIKPARISFGWME